MKTICFTGLCALTPLLPATVHALDWNAGVSDGRRDGTWNNGSAPNWNDTAGADPSTNRTWSVFLGNFTPAVFNAPQDGTVTVDGTVRTSGIQAGDGGAYSLDGGTINKLFGNLTIDVGTAGSGTLAIGSTLSNGTVIKQGDGRLSLFGTTTGDLRIDDGLVVLSGNNLPDGADLEVRSGAGVQLDGPETVNELRLDGTLAGTGALTATTYLLRDGAVVDGFLAEGNFIKADAGTVTIRGYVSSEVIAIPDGTLVLTGNNLADAARVTTSGTGRLEVNGNDTVQSYTQSDTGALTGIGTLTASGSAILNGGEIAGSLGGNTIVRGDVLVSGRTSGQTLTVENGTLTVTGEIRSSDIAVRAGATLLQQGEFFSRSSLTNNGTLTVDSDAGPRYDLTAYVQNSGGLLNGSRPLSVTEATLHGGEVAGTLAGDEVTSAGDVLVTGHISGRTLTVDSGTLTLSGSADYQRAFIEPGATLMNQGDLGARSHLENFGTLVNDRETTVAYYEQLGGLLTGSAPLHASGVTLNGGEVVGNLTGNAVYSSGQTLVSGGIGGGRLSVDDGTLTLTGTSTNDPVTIRPGATLVDQGDLADTAMVTNDGTLTVDVAETIGSYTQNPGGRLDGAGTLTATNGATLTGGEVAGSLLGDTTVSTGRNTLTISGNVGGGTLLVTDGRLDLTGTVSNPLVEVTGGRLTLSGDNIDDDSTLAVRSGARIDVDGDDTVGTTSIAGVAWGTGTLTASTYTLLDGAIINTRLGEGAFDKADAGTVRLNRTLGSDTIGVPRGTLVLGGDNLEDTADVFTAGTGVLELLGSDTVGTYTQDAGGMLRGTGTLTATNGATLNGGEVAGALHSTITSTGDVLISGTISGGGLAIDSGTLTLTGSSSNRTVSIAGGATLADKNRGLDMNAVLTNSGTLRSTSRIDTYISNGGTFESGTLEVESVAALNDGSVVAGDLRGDTTSNGIVLISGSAGKVGTLSVNSGVLTVTGRSNYQSVSIAAGASLVDDGRSSSYADYMNAGTLTVNVDDTIATYTSNGGRLDGTGTLTATGGAILNDGSLISGKLIGGTTTTSGAVTVDGIIGGDVLAVESGRLWLLGKSNHQLVTIAPGAELEQRFGGFDPNAAIINAGDLIIIGSDRVASYTSNGGTLGGAPRLFVNDRAILNDGSVIGGELYGDVISRGNVVISGSRGILYGGTLTVDGGSLTLDGGIIRSEAVTIQAGARIVDQSDKAFINSADLTNHGVLVLDGSETLATYHNSPTGALQLKVTGPSVLDHLTANTVTLESGSTLILEKTELLIGQVADLIDGAIEGTFARIEALAGVGKDLRYAFNPNNGSIQALPGRPLPPATPSDTLYNLSANQTQVIGTVFDATYLDPATTPGMDRVGNFRRIYYRDTGSADPTERWQEIQPWQGRPGDTYAYDLDPGLGRAPVAPGSQAALLGDAITLFQASYDVLRDDEGAPVLDEIGQPVPVVTEPGLAIANALSPQVHQGMADFSRQALRSQVRTAMRTAPMTTAGKGTMFAAIHSTSAGSDGGADGASYDLDLEGAVAGLRYEFIPNLQVGAMLGMLGGDIKGPHIDTDGGGIMFGLFGEYLLEPATRTILSSSLAYGSYEYDAQRRSFGGSVFANDIGSDAWEFAIGIESVAYQADRFRVIPRAALRYLNGDVDGFKEQGHGARMQVDSIKTTSLLLELAVDAEFDVNEHLTLRAEIGGLTDLKGSGGHVSGSYLGGGLPVGVSAPGIDGEAFIFGLGGSYELNEATRLDLNWRSELRDGSQNTHLVSFGTRVSF